MVQLTLASEFSGLGLLVHNRSRVRVIEGDRPSSSVSDLVHLGEGREREIIQMAPWKQRYLSEAG